MSTPTVTTVRHSNPRKRKSWTYEQAEAKKQQAEKFTREVLEDDDRADELADMSVEDYAEERGVDLVDSEQGDSMLKRKKNGARPGTATAEPAAADVRINPAVALQSAADALKEQNVLQKRVRKLEDELADRDRMLDEIVGILEDDDVEFTPEDRLEAIDKVFPEDDEKGEG